MKELSIEEKAKAYDEAIVHAKLLLKTIGNATLGNLVLKNEFERMFPELKEESWDERIRKALIDGFTVMKESKNCGKTFSNNNIPVEDILSWLEKQGKQKPAWGEEDEKMLDIILSDINYAQKNFSDSKLIPYGRKVDWLKSIKERYTWKPSDGQMDELENEHLKSVPKY